MTDAMLRSSDQQPCLHCGVVSSQRFCCSGCEAAYALRDDMPVFTGGHYRGPDVSPSDYSRFVDKSNDNVCSLAMMVEGMRCASCGFLIENTLNAQKDVEARVNITTRRLVVTWKGDEARGNILAAQIMALGYKLMPYDAEKIKSEDVNEERELLYCLAVAGFASGNIMMFSVGLWASTLETMGVATRDLLHWLSAAIALPTVIYAGRPFFRSAWEALKNKRTNMDVPISVALCLTTGMSFFEVLHHGEFAYFDSVVMLLFLLLIGRYLDRRTRGKARAAAEDLLMMMAGTATIIEEGQLRLVPIRELKAGHIIQVAVGEKIAADGVVASGVSEIDPSFITGETITQPVCAGTAVYGGMINITSPITVTITMAADSSLLADVIKLMEKAEQGHAHYVRMADRVARAYTPVVHALAAGTFAYWMAVLHAPWQQSLLVATTVLIITCPCALGLAVPAVQVLASSRLFKRGMLLKSADALERLAEVDTIVFDKTGTLTCGQAVLANPADIGAHNMQMAVSMAAHSKHPLARSLVAMYGGKLHDLSAVREVAGCGIEAEWDGKVLRLGRRDWCGDMAAQQDDRPELWLGGYDNHPVRFSFTDALRSDAARVIGELRSLGFAIKLMSGDRDGPVEAVAKKLGIVDYTARATPVDKNEAIDALKAQGRKVLMVGDGLNDAPALLAAHVSISPSTALDITQNSADIVFQGEKLGAVCEAIQTARRATRLVKQNFILSFLYNALAVPMAMMGVVTPLIAALAMSGSSIAVVLNAMRVKKG